MYRRLWTILLLTLIISCKANTERKSIIGRWEYNKTGYKNDDKITWKFEEESKRHTMTFDQNGNLFFDSGQSQQIIQKYRLTSNGKQILTKSGEFSKTDTTSIITLKDDILQLEMTYGNILELKKIR
jgi:hypothetical protein